MWISRGIWRSRLRWSEGDLARIWPPLREYPPWRRRRQRREHGLGNGLSRERLLGRRFRMTDGDGDRTYFNVPTTLLVVARPWFPDKIQGEEALLLEAEDGAHAGSFFAITSHQVASMTDQLDFANWISVVIHTVVHSESTTNDAAATADPAASHRVQCPFGMTSLELLP